MFRLYIKKFVCKVKFTNVTLEIHLIKWFPIFMNGASKYRPFSNSNVMTSIKIQNIVLKQFLFHRIGNHLNSDNIEVLWRLSFSFPWWRLFKFINIMETGPNITKPKHKERLDRDIRGQKFVKLLKKLAENFTSLPFLWVNNQLIYKFFQIQVK